MLQLATKCCMCYYRSKMIELFWARAMYTLTTNNKHHCWYPVFAAVFILITYVIYDWNSLNACTYFIYYAWTGYSSGKAQDGKLHVLLLTCYTTRNMICAYIAHVLPVSISWNFLSTSTNTNMQMSSLDWSVLYSYVCT